MAPLDFDDIFDVWEPAWWQSPWVWLLSAAIVVALCLIGYLLARLWRRRAPVDQKVVLLQRLRALEPQGVFEQQQAYKEFYVALIDVMRDYLALYHGLACEGKTDSELLRYVQQQPLDRNYSELMERLMAHACPVKFAREDGKEDHVRIDYATVAQLLVSAQQEKC